MPSPRPKAPLGLRDFGFPRPKRRPAAPIPPRAATLIRLMVYGPDDAASPPMTLTEAAVHMGIKRSTAAHYFRHPAARAEYLRLVRDLREAEQARNLHAATSIRDDDQMKASAAGNRARVEAMRFIEHDSDDKRGGVHINVGVAVQSQPGYIVRAVSDPDRLARALARAGSVSTIDADLIEHAPAPVVAAPEPSRTPPADAEPERPATSPGLHLDPRAIGAR